MSLYIPQINICVGIPCLDEFLVLSANDEVHTPRREAGEQAEHCGSETRVMQDSRWFVNVLSDCCGMFINSSEPSCRRQTATIDLAPGNMSYRKETKAARRVPHETYLCEPKDNLKSTSLVARRATRTQQITRPGQALLTGDEMETGLSKAVESNEVGLCKLEGGRALTSSRRTARTYIYTRHITAARRERADTLALAQGT